MPRLPTVTMKHRKTGRIKTVNVTDYARDIAGWKDYERISETRGNATDKEVKLAALESDDVKKRLADPKREKKFGDHRRAQEHNASKTNVVTEAPEHGTMEDPAPAWRNMPWMEQAKFVREVTGTYPRSKKQAEALMTASSGAADKEPHTV